MSTTNLEFEVIDLTVDKKDHNMSTTNLEFEVIDLTVDKKDLLDQIFEDIVYIDLVGDGVQESPSIGYYRKHTETYYEVINRNIYN